LDRNKPIKLHFQHQPYLYKVSLFPHFHSLLLIGWFKMVDKITPTDPRIQFKTANLNGVTYCYILAEPLEKAVDTIFLVHGWPDLALGWR
jgi:hypothetical protein